MPLSASDQQSLPGTLRGLLPACMWWVPRNACSTLCEAGSFITKRIPHVTRSMCLLDGQVTHELSVPAVTAMLLSALAFATAAWSGLVLADALSPRARAGLQALAALAALAATVAVRTGYAHVPLCHGRQSTACLALEVS